MISFLFLLINVSFGLGNVLRLDINTSVKLALKRNPDLKLINLRLKKSRLDIDQKYIDLYDTRFKKNSRKLDLMRLKNQRQVIIDSVYYNVYEKYYNCLIALERKNIAIEDLRYTRSFYNNSYDNFEAGKLDETSFKRRKEEYKQKEEELTLSKGVYSRAVLAFLLTIGEGLDINVKFIDSIEVIYKHIDFDKSLPKLLKKNRNILEVRLNNLVTRLKYDLVDKKIMSKNEVLKAEYNLKESRIQFEQEVRRQKVELVNRYLLVNENSVSLETAIKAVNRAKQAYEVDDTRYRKGYISRNMRDRSLIVYKRQLLRYLTLVKNYNLAKIRYFFLFN